MERFLGIYWVIYFLAYLIASAILLWLYWDGLLYEDANTRLFLLAAIFGTAAGTAFIFTILVEVGGNTMLLIPRRIRQLRRQGSQERDKRYREAYRLFGVKVDGVLMLPDTPEVQAFLDANPDESGKLSD